MHKNYFVFVADNYRELGFQIGRRFQVQAHSALDKNSDIKNPKIQKISREMLALSQNHFPDYIDELKGYAQGAKVDFLSLWIQSLETDVFLYDQISPAKCTTIITNQGKLIGHNEDAFTPDQKDEVCVVRKTIKGRSSLEIFYYNSLGGSAVGVNAHGFTQTINTLFFTKTQMGLPKSVSARFLFDTHDPLKDIEILKKIKRSTGYSHNLVNLESKVWNVVVTADKINVAQPDFPFIHTNHCLDANTRQ